MMRLAGYLHDIGKLIVPEEILEKQGRLTTEEYNQIKYHSYYTNRLLMGIQEFDTIRAWASMHHERMDGTGYPAGLVGDAIPLCARIVALADVYDALTSKRVYKNAFAHDVARGIITSESGDHFDPLVVEAFLACEEEFIAIRNRYMEGVDSE
jgi:putative two-component system response regulator